MQIDFQCIPAEKAGFSDNAFDVVTACQCFPYFDHAVLAPRIHGLLKQDGIFAVLYMAWLPFEDPIAGKSEELVLTYNPTWTGCREIRHLISIPEIYKDYFTIEREETFDVSVPFTRESWNGRMKSCRGIGASLSEDEISGFEAEHLELLKNIAPPTFEVLHYAAITVMKKRLG